MPVISATQEAEVGGMGSEVPGPTCKILSDKLKVKRTRGVIQVVEHLPISSRPGVQSPLLLKKYKLKKKIALCQLITTQGENLSSKLDCRYKSAQQNKLLDHKQKNIFMMFRLEKES
jgi:hypothetical protein